MQRLLSHSACLLLLLGGLTFCAWTPAADEPPPPAGVVATLRGHKEMVYGIAFSPDGKTVATGSFDMSIKLWDAATGKETKTFAGPAGHQKQVLSVVFSPDGHNLASGSQDNTVKVWDVPSSSPLRDFVHAEAVSGLALNPDGSRLAGAGKDGTIKVWNTADGKQLFNLEGHTGPVLGVAFNGKGETLASCGSDGTVRFWNTADGKSVASLIAHTGAANAVLFHPANNSVWSAGEDGTLKTWQWPVVAPRALPAHADVVNAVVLSLDGSQVYSASADKTVGVTTFANGQQVRRLSGPAAAVTCLAVNGTTIAGGTADNQLFLWNAADGKVICQGAAHDKPVTAVALHPQNSQVITAGADGTIKVWPMPKTAKLSDVKPLATLDAHAGGVTSLSFHGNGTQILSGGADKSVKLWDVASGKMVRTFGPGADPVSAVSLSRDGTLVGAAAGKNVVVWNSADAKQVIALPHPAEVLSLSFNADKTRLVTGGADNLARVWDLATGKELQAFSQGGPVRSVSFHPSNPAIVTGSADKTVTVHTPAIVRMAVAPGIVRALAVTPTGSHILTAGDDRTIRLWNTSSGANERSFPAGDSPLVAVAVSKNGSLAASGGMDGSVRLYNFADGKALDPLKAASAVRGLAFSPSNQFLAAASEDRSVLAWNVTFTPGQPPSPDFGKVVQTFAHTGPATGVVFVADNATLYSSGQDRAIKAWKIASEAPTKTFSHPNLVDAVAYNPDGSLLATACHDGVVRIWDPTKGQVVKEIQAHTQPQPSPVYCLAWSPDGKQIVSGSLDRSLKLWDAAAGTSVREFKAYKEKDFEKGHTDGVFCVAFSPDGKFLASGSSDHTIKVWNVADGTVARECINPKLKIDPLPGVVPLPPQAHPGWVYSLRYTVDGKYLVSAGNAPNNQGYLAVWNAADAKMIYGEALPLGPFYSVAMAPDGKVLALGCGPQSRQTQEVNSYLLKMPEGAK